MELYSSSMCEDRGVEVGKSSTQRSLLTCAWAGSSLKSVRGRFVGQQKQLLTQGKRAPVEPSPVDPALNPFDLRLVDPECLRDTGKDRLACVRVMLSPAVLVAEGIHVADGSGIAINASEDTPPSGSTDARWYSLDELQMLPQVEFSHGALLSIPLREYRPAQLIGL